MNEEKKDFMWQVNHDTARAIAELRQHHGLTIEQAAERADYEPDKLAAVEAGKLPHNIHNVARIVEALGGRLAIIPQENEQDPHCQFIELEESTMQ